MKFINTRSGESVSAAEAILSGMAEGGGLYVPELFPKITGEEMEQMLGYDYPERTALILGKFFGEFPAEELLSALREAYSRFEGDDPIPLVKIEDGLYLLELFHGPTCAQEDLGVTLLPYLIEESKRALKAKGDILVLTATSGDAGKSVLQTFRGREGVKAAVIYPEEGVSKMQKLQLCTQEGENLNVIAVRGNFDDCQSAVRKILRSQENRDKLKEKGYLVTAGGSVNIGELLPRVAAFFSAYLDLVSSEQLAMGDLMDFALPAGNLGSVLAAFYAKKMGLPVGRIICASNRNNGLCEFLTKGTFEKRKNFFRTMSPSLDVLNPCNLERLIFELSGRDSNSTVERMKSLANTGKFSLRAEEWKELSETFFGGYAGEDETVECVFEFFEEFNYPLDTHTGVAVHAARLYTRKREEDINAEARPMVVIVGASPYKFPQAVYYALTGNDVKDSFKGLKRIHLITAMKIPEALKECRYKPIRFKTAFPSEKVFEEVLNFVG